MIAKGQRINDRYEIIRSIGEGGMANVYLGYDEILDRNVAIKILRGDLVGDEKFVRRFQREALSASSLSHPNIVEMYDVGEDDGMYYIVMEYIEGITLKQLLKKRGKLTLSEAIDIMLQLTDGMAHAHESYIIHRDLKPQNIMIEDDGQVKITDFGIAMALNSTQLTQTNSVMGSVHYLPPEQAAGKGSTIKSDIYSLGIIFYELLSGSLPFRGENAVEIALKHMKEPLPNLMEENSGIPQSIENIIMKATAKNPKNRYNDVKDMHHDLLTALDDDKMNEEPYVYPYSENEENTKTIRKLEQLEDDEEQLAEKIADEDNKKSKKIIIILASVLGAIVLLLLFIFFILPELTGGKEIKVPNLKEMTVAEAKKELKNLGFKGRIVVKTVNDQKIAKGKIVKTDPAKGKKIKSKSKITFYKSDGVKTYEIEDYTGKNYIEVQTLLTNMYGLKVTIEKKDVDDGNDYKDKEQEIIGQSIEAGEKVKKGTKITLYIPNIEEKFPDMKNGGWSLSDVQDFCKKYGIALTYDEVETTAFEEGKVISQSVSPNTKMSSVKTLKVEIAKKPTEKKPEEKPKEETKEEEKEEEKTEEGNE